MQNYCTLFDKNYLIFGLALHQSLLRQSGDFRLYMLAMDSECERILRQLDLRQVFVVPLHYVVTPEYDHIRQQMSFGQLCWTCQPLLCKYVLRECAAHSVVYLEADSYFFDDPAVLLEEIGDKAVSLVPHAYSEGFDQTPVSGIYCVQFNRFGSDDESARLLADWEANCLKYDKDNRNYLPGQLCLDDWPQRSDAVHVVGHPGAGVAPWNLGGRRFSSRDGHVLVDGARVNFYHFHELSFLGDRSLYLSSYPMGRDVVDLVYKPYARELAGLRKQLREAVPGFDFFKRLTLPTFGSVLASPGKASFRHYLRYLWMRVSGRLADNTLPL